MLTENQTTDLRPQTDFGATVLTHRGFGRRVEVNPVLRLLTTDLSQGEDALRHRTLPWVVCLQAQHQRTAAQLLEVQRKHKGLHERHILKNRDRKIRCVVLNKWD